MPAAKPKSRNFKAEREARAKSRLNGGNNKDNNRPKRDRQGQSASW